MAFMFCHTTTPRNRLGEDVVGIALYLTVRPAALRTISEGILRRSGPFRKPCFLSFLKSSTSNQRMHISTVQKACFLLLLCTLVAGAAVGQDRQTGIHQAATDTASIMHYEQAFSTRRDTLRLQGSGPFLIRPFLEAGSERVMVNGTAATDYHLDYREGLIYLSDIAPDSSILLIVDYRHIPLDLESSYQMWERYAPPVQREAGRKKTSVGRENLGLLTTRGQVSRGIMTGNRRDPRIESGLKLEVKGEVAPGITLHANLSDEDTPLVPEGVTRQFDQFDRIQIRLSSGKGDVRLGDYEAAMVDTRYGVLRRKLQGASLSSSNLGTGWKWISSIRVGAGAAVSRGQFHSTDVTILDGVQGPYRLLGAAGERFILVLPGTERVYLDGVLLERGPDRDYVMDYQLGEVTFTSRHVMGRERRVRIDYEYTTNRYTRTMTFSEASLGLGGTATQPWARLTVGGIREADGDAFLDESGLSSADSVLIASSNSGVIQVDGAIPVVYDTQALYTQYVRQTAPTGTSVWVELTRLPSAGQIVYRVPFSFVGQGDGSYRRIPSQGGGIAYEWVGEGNGSYEPVRTLPVPSSKSIGELRLQVLGVPGVTLEGGIAASSLDVNRLSPGRASLRQGRVHDILFTTVPFDLAGNWQVSARASGHVRTANFETFERIRSIEFAREWALPIVQENPFGSLLPGTNERLLETSLRISRQDSSYLEAGTGRLSLGSQVNAQRNLLSANVILPAKTRLVGNINATRTRGTHEGEALGSFRTERRFITMRLSPAAAQTRWRPWVEVQEDRWIRDGSGLLQVQEGQGAVARMPYRSAGAGMERVWESHVIAFSGSLRREEDVRSDRSTLLAGSHIRTWQAAWEWEPSARARSAATVGWRRSRSSQDGTSSAQKDQDALLIGLNGRVRSVVGGSLQWNYEVRSEQTAAMQEIYIRTGPDRGQYVWQDINGDGRIQLDEYFPETIPGEGEYARTLFPSDSLEAVTTAEAGLSYQWLPTATASRWRRVSVNASVDIRETTRADDRVGIYLLQPSALRQSGQTVNGRIRMSGRLGLYPLRRDRDISFSLLRIASLVELANGSESSERSQLSLEWREEIRDNLDLTLASTASDDRSLSAQFASRAFSIQRWEVRPGVIVRWEDWRLQTEGLYGQSQESRSGARVNTLRLPLTVFRTSGQMRWRAGGERSQSAIEGGVPLGLQLFELTQGRGEGTSWMWHLHLDMQLTEIVTATLRYDGRSPTGLPVIHTGRFQLSARF